MAELADALDSGSSESNFMQVQVLFPAPDNEIRTRFSELEMGSDFFLSPNRKDITHQTLRARSVCKGLRFLGSLAK